MQKIQGFYGILDIALDPIRPLLYLTTGNDILQFQTINKYRHKVSNADSDYLFFFNCELYGFQR